MRVWRPQNPSQRPVELTSQLLYSEVPNFDAELLNRAGTQHAPALEVMNPKPHSAHPLILSAILCATLLVLSSSLRAASITFSINATGAKEVNAAGVPDQGDPDGSAIGTLLLDNGTGSGTTGLAVFNLNLSNLDPATVDLTGHHIHQAPATTTGSIVVNFGDPDAIRSGTTLTGTITGLPAATITAIFANPSGFYYNLHNAQFPAGAVRDQLSASGVPDGGSAAALFGLATLLLVGLRKMRG